MSIQLGDLKIYGSAVMPDDDSVLQIGGAIDLTKTVEFNDVAGALQAVSGSSGDTTQSVTVSYRDNSGNIQTLIFALNGQTVVTDATAVERLLKAVKSATTAGAVAVEAQTALRTGTAQAGATRSITLDSGASAVDDAFRGSVVRITGGPGQGAIAQGVSYNGTTKVLQIDHDWDYAVPTSSSTFRVSNGFYFAKLPAEVSQVRRPFYNASADPAVAKSYYEKMFLKNTASSLALTAAVVKEFADPSGKITFTLATTKDDTGTNGPGNNRQVAPSSGVGTFDNADKGVPSSSLGSNESIGVWLRLTLAAGDAAQNTTYTPRLQGTTT